MKERICRLIRMNPPEGDDLLSASGTTLPTDGTAGYAAGCIFQKTDGGVATSLYVNEGSGTSCDFNSAANETSVLLGATAGVVTASVAVVVDASKDIGDFGNLDAVNIDLGASGTKGTLDVFPTTAGSGKLIIDCADQDTNTNVTLRAAGQQQACVVSIPDPGATTANVLLTDQANDKAVCTATAAELSVLDGVTAGVVLASGGVVVDASKDVGDFRNLDCVNLDCGASGTAGSVDIFPGTGSKGKLIIDCTAQDADTNVTLRAAAAALAQVISIPDCGAASANVMLTSAGNDKARVVATATEIDVLNGVTGGTATASKALVVDGSKHLAQLGNLGATNLDLGLAAGGAGTLDIFPTTGSKGKFILDCTDQTGNTNVTLRAAAMGQGTVVSMIDPGAATANVMLTSAANAARIVATQAEIDTLNGVTGGTATASKALVVDASKHLAQLGNLGVTNLDAGLAAGGAGTVDIFPTTGSKGKLILTCGDQDGNTNVTVDALGMGQATAIDIPDPGAVAAEFVLTTQTNDNSPVTATNVELNQLDGAILADMTEGSGITGLSGGVIAHSVSKIGGLFHTRIFIDLTGLNGCSASGDIIGKDGGVANCHIGQITAALNGAIWGAQVTCLETPAGGHADIDIWSATEANGVQDTTIGGLAETKMFDGDTLAAHEVLSFLAYPAADQYLYLVVGDAGFVDADFSAGKILIELWGA